MRFAHRSGTGGGLGRPGERRSPRPPLLCSSGPVGGCGRTRNSRFQQRVETTVLRCWAGTTVPWQPEMPGSWAIEVLC
jgi:hypothetical protein